MTRATLPQGFRDFSGKALSERRYILTLLERHFVAYGFVPLETPAMEHLATLMGKYGDEGDQLLFKVLNSGEALRGLTAGNLEAPASQLVKKIAKKGLRYDLTIPLARYVAQNKHALYFPFKRYQMQSVWRADRPQRGRYREFLQCDIDVVGSSSLFHEANLLALVHQVLTALKIKGFQLHLNHRKLLHALADQIGLGAQEVFFCQTLDKLEKAGWEKVATMLASKGIGADSLAVLQDLFATQGQQVLLEKLQGLLADHPLGIIALDELRKILDYLHQLAPKAGNALVLDPSLARGMGYYTGAIFEAKVPHSSLGSIVGGGRYDGLTEIFGVEGIEGVGLSFGLDRLNDLMREQNLFPENIENTTQVLFVPMATEMEAIAIDYLGKLRQHGIASELYPAGTRMKRVFSFANKKQIPWVVVIGSDELTAGVISLRNMVKGTQKSCNFATLLKHLNTEA